MNIKNNKGITGIDVTISIVILALFISLITNMFYNVSKIGKSIERKTEATYTAIQIIESIKQLKYNDLPTGETEGATVLTLEELNTKLGEEKAITLKNGYSANIKVENYRKIKGNIELQDKLKKVTVTINYKNQNQEQSIEINTVIVNEEHI